VIAQANKKKTRLPDILRTSQKGSAQGLPGNVNTAVQKIPKFVRY
jgi:hypothetical protein